MFPHLFIKRIDKNYTRWIFHREEETWNENEDGDNANENDWVKNIDDVKEILDA